MNSNTNPLSQAEWLKASIWTGLSLPILQDFKKVLQRNEKIRVTYFGEQPVLHAKRMIMRGDRPFIEEDALYAMEQQGGMVP